VPRRSRAVGDLAVAVAAGHEAQDVALALGQALAGGGETAMPRRNVAVSAGWNQVSPRDSARIAAAALCGLARSRRPAATSATTPCERCEREIERAARGAAVPYLVQVGGRADRRQDLARSPVLPRSTAPTGAL